MRRRRAGDVARPLAADQYAGDDFVGAAFHVDAASAGGRLRRHLDRCWNNQHTDSDTGVSASADLKNITTGYLKPVHVPAAVQPLHPTPAPVHTRYFILSMLVVLNRRQEDG